MDEWLVENIALQTFYCAFVYFFIIAAEQKMKKLEHARLL